MHVNMARKIEILTFFNFFPSYFCGQYGPENLWKLFIHQDKIFGHLEQILALKMASMPA